MSKSRRVRRIRFPLPTKRGRGERSVESNLSSSGNDRGKGKRSPSMLKLRRASFYGRHGGKEGALFSEEEFWSTSMP